MRYDLLKDLVAQEEPMVPDEAKPGVVVEFFDNPCTRVLMYKLFQQADHCLQVLMNPEEKDISYWRGCMKTYEEVLKGLAQWAFEDDPSLQDGEGVQEKTWRGLRNIGGPVDE